MSDIREIGTIEIISRLDIDKPLRSRLRAKIGIVFIKIGTWFVSQDVSSRS